MARSAPDTIRELQRTLYRAAKADPQRRFHALYDKFYRRDVMAWSWELVRTNGGAAGVDQTTIADIEDSGVDRFLDELAADLNPNHSCDWVGVVVRGGFGAAGLR